MADLLSTSITGGVIQKSGTNTVSTVVAIKPYLEVDSISFESTNSISFVSTAYDINADKIVVAYRDDTDAGKGKAIVGSVSAVSVSPAVITWGTPVTFANYETTATAGSNSAYNGPAIVYDVNAQKMVIAWSKGDRNPNGIGTYAGKGTSKVGTVSGTGTGATITFSGAEGDWDTSGLTPDGTDVNFTKQLKYEPNAQKMVITWHGYGNTNTQGSSPIIGMQGWASVGTVSGTSISWGTAVLVESDAESNATTGGATGAEYRHASLVYDTASQNIVIAWEGSTASLGTQSMIRVGTVSGTSITFGPRIKHMIDTTVLPDADASDMSYDTAAQKIVLIYTDYSTYIGDRYATARVGTVSGTGGTASIALGIPVAYNRAPVRGNNIIYNTNAQKHLVTSVRYTVTDPMVNNIQSQEGTVTSVTLTCTTTNSSTTVTTASTSSLAVGMSISGTGMGAGSDPTTVTTITSITNATTFVLSANATASGSTSLIFTSISFSEEVTIERTSTSPYSYTFLNNPSAYDSSTYRMYVSRPSPNPSVMITNFKASAITIDLSTGGIFTLDLQNTDGPGITSFTVSNVDQTTNTVQSFILKITQGSHGPVLATGVTSRQIIWSELTNIKWPSDEGPNIPTLTATDNAVDILSFTTYDKGVTWYGSVVGQNFI